MCVGHRPGWCRTRADLQGGVAGCAATCATTARPDQGGALEQTQRIIETRVNAIGVGEPDITIQGETTLVQLPGIKDQKRVLDLVGKTAELRFRLRSPSPPRRRRRTPTSRSPPTARSSRSPRA